MPPFARIIVSALVFFAVYNLSFWAVFVQILPGSLVILATILAFAAAVAACRWSWRKTASAAHGVFTTACVWAAAAGAIGFCGGFFGPMVFAPDANQGPLLGIFITGPLGFFGGGMAGMIYGFWRRKPAQRGRKKKEVA